jgi:hypothetical protein
MKKNDNSKNWFALVIAILIVILVSLLVFYILAYIIPFAKNTKGIENASKAYYMAESWVEDSLYAIKKNWEWYSSWTTFNNSPIWTSLKISGSWTVLPPSWRGNSDYNKDFNIIKIWEPIQLKIWKWAISNWDNVNFTFRVPDLDWGWDISWNAETLSWANELNIINWKLVSKTDLLDASWSLIVAGQINWKIWYESVKWWNTIYKTWINSIWKVLSDSSNKTFKSFYINNCKWINNECTLKMSIVNELESVSGNKLPYLEWKINFWNSVPLRYAIIDTSGKSYGYKKDLEVKKWQQTVVEAADFTVIQ